ncbi:MAG: SAM-dependent methyltransferase [Actinomycetota bacterium]|nr:SAM-dependent methyltransferase [Actinomycetota bacterium]
MNPLAARLRERIAASGPISFSSFMESALYDPQDGFYARGARLGTKGAFTTAPIAAPFLARALGAELRAVWERLGRPRPLTVVEVGPGEGSLAAGLAAELADLPLELVLCERAAGMLAQARARVPAAGSIELAQLAAIRGAIVANEVHDACPAHRLRWPCELLVDVGADGRFAFVPGPPAGALGDPLRAAGVTPVVGAEYDVSPAQAELQRVLAKALQRGALFVLDYGEAGALRYERPQPRLRTYVGGMAGGDPLAAPGTQDITVDVDFGALRAAGEVEGLRTTLDIRQPEWLLAHGAEAAIARLPRHAADRLWLEALSDPDGSGAAFRVLVQERD